MNQRSKRKRHNKAAWIWSAALTLALLAACAPLTREAPADSTGAGPGSADSPAAGNGPAAASPQPAARAQRQADFPRTIELSGDKAVTIAAKPQRIVAISLDTAEAALELAGPSRIAAITRSIGNRSLAFQAEEGEAVGSKLGSATAVDPETILAMEPDLILLTTQHGSEADADRLLAQAGVPLVSFEPWNSLERIRRHFLLIGRLLGEEARAEERIAEMTAKIADVQSRIATVPAKPSLLVISPVGTNTGPYVLGPDSLASDIVRKAGAVPAVESMGLRQTAKADLEQVLKEDPDYILLADWDGSGQKAYDEWMNDPGWQTLKAVRHNRVKIIPAKYVMTASVQAAEGIERIARWLHPASFGEGERP